MPLKSYFQYDWTVTKDAFVQTMEHFPSKWISASIIGVLAVGVEFIVFGWEEALGEFHWLISAVTAILVYGIAVFSWNIATAPHRLWRRDQNRIKNLLHRTNKNSEYPEPIFLSHSEGAGRQTPSVSWLHLKVDATDFQPNRAISNATIDMKIAVGKTVHEKHMRWQSDLPEGSSTTTLTHGAIKRVPIARRNDGAYAAQITDGDYLVNSRNTPGLEELIPNLFSLTKGTYDVHFIIKSGKRKWESRLYKLHVPTNGMGNSHFHLEKIEY